MKKPDGKAKESIGKLAVGIPPAPTPPPVAEPLRRSKPQDKDKGSGAKGGNVPVSAGPLERVIDYTFNPSRDKIREVTVIDRIQSRLFPQLDMVNMLRGYCLQVAQYRADRDTYKQLYLKDKPIPPDAIDELIYRSAQWQKSVEGKNLQSAVDIALAETEARGAEGEEPISGHGFEED